MDRTGGGSFNSFFPICHYFRMTQRKTLHVGIFGPGLSGKTTLAKKLSQEYWMTSGIKSIVLDPIGDDWGAQAFVTDNEEIFLRMVRAEKQCAVFVDEASQTIKRDKDKTPLFTSIRHGGHRMHVIGHDGMSLLPVMREQLQTLFLFRQSMKPLAVWSELLSEPRIFEASNLQQYEFLWCRLYHPPVKCVLRQ